jgi:hypothetical protein
MLDSNLKEAIPLLSPWKEFLSEIDSMLTEPLNLHCIGGFVVCYFYGLPRTTGDIDYYTAVPANFNLMEAAGEGSSLAKKYKVRLPLRANIRETPVVPLINEQGEKEKGRDEWHFSWCSFLGGFGWRGTERRRAKRAAAQWSGSQSGCRLPAGFGF